MKDKIKFALFATEAVFALTVLWLLGEIKQDDNLDDFEGI